MTGIMNSQVSCLHLIITNQILSTLVNLFEDLVNSLFLTFAASILRADMKYGKKQFVVDENRRDTYRQFHPLSPPNDSSSFANSKGDMKRLVTVCM